MGALARTSCVVVLSGCTLITSLGGREFRDPDPDGGPDAGTGPDGGSDAGPFDAGPFDAGPFDAGPCEGACGGETPFCDPELGCVACIDDGDCDDREPCTGDRCGLGVCQHDPVPECIAGVTVGDLHWCAWRVNGEMLCWGNNDSGHLGDGTTDPSDGMPHPVVSYGDAVQMSAGASHSCAVRRAGGIICWGADFEGQLGNDGTFGGATPTPVTVMSISTAAQVDLDMTSGGFACARLSSGGIRCWGNGDYGQLGNGETADQPAPVTVMGVVDAVDVSAGVRHACAVRAGGGALCWGDNGHGQLGTGIPGTRFDTPVPVAGLVDAIDIEAGQLFTCALRAGGAVACWGRNAAGALGDGTTTDRYSPGPVVGVTDAVQIAVGDHHACALRANGVVLCWGSNTGGALGNGPGSESSTPVGASGLDDVISIAAGRHDVCARRVNGTVVCWGASRGSDRPTEVTGL